MLDLLQQLVDVRIGDAVGLHVRPRQRRVESLLLRDREAQRTAQRPQPQLEVLERELDRGYGWRGVVGFMVLQTPPGDPATREFR